MKTTYRHPEAANAIDKLKELQPDWDSYGAGVPVMSACEQAKGFIHDIAQTFGPEHANPTVGPTADGGVALIWRKPGHPKVEVFFSPDSARFIVFQGRTVIEKGPLRDYGFIKQFVIK